MTTLNSPNYASDWLKSESGTGEFYSRDQGVLASGQGKLVTGTVLAQLTANGKFVVAAATGADGSQTAGFILFDRAVDATSADQPIVVVARHAVVSHAGPRLGPFHQQRHSASRGRRPAQGQGHHRPAGGLTMETILDIFNNDAFSANTLTDNVNVVPNIYGRLNELGLFRDEPIPTTTVSVNIVNGVLNLLPTRPRGAPGTLGTPEKRKLKSFVVPHIPHNDAVLATDVQNMIAWASGLTSVSLETVIGYMNRKLITMRRKHAITLENLRMGAVKGQILDADGTLLLDLFAEYGVTQKTFDFLLGTPGTDVGGICDDISGYTQDNLLGDTLTYIHGLASPSFMKRLLGHASVKAAYQFFNQANGGNPNRDNLRKQFPFHGILFEEYRGTATYLNEDGSTTVQQFVPDGDVRLFPMGTTETFSNYWAPPDFVSAVNEPPSADAQVFVAPLEPMKFGKGLEVHTESNPLPLCKRPQLLVRGFSSN